MSNSKNYFHALCLTAGIEVNIASKIINGKYKPYLSAVDNKYYEGNNVWDAKTEALLGALKKHTAHEIKLKLKRK